MVHELRPVALPGEAGQVTCGADNTFPVSAGGALLGGGANGNDQLGLGHRQDQSLPQPVPLPAGMGALHVLRASLGSGSSAGLAGGHSCVIGVLG